MSASGLRDAAAPVDRVPLRLGVNPVIWTNDDLPALGDDISVERCLSEARAAGYGGIELGHKLPPTPEELGPLLAAYGLRLVSGWYGGRLLERGLEAELEAVRSRADLLLALGSEVIVYAEVSGCVHGVRGQPIEARRRLASADFEEFGHALTAFAEALQRMGLGLAYHHHMGTVVQTIDELDRLLASTGDVVGLTLDTGHLAFAGSDPAAVVRRVGSRVRHVHLKDVRGTVLGSVARGRASYLDAIVDGVFTVPGDGDLDFRDILAALAEVGYRGWLVVEADQDPALAEPAEFALKGAAHVRRVAAELGLALDPPAPT